MGWADILSTLRACHDRVEIPASIGRMDSVASWVILRGKKKYKKKIPDQTIGDFQKWLVGFSAYFLAGAFLAAAFLAGAFLAPSFLTAVTSAVVPPDFKAAYACFAILDLRLAA